MRDQSGFAFTGEYLGRQEMQFFEDLDVLAAMYIALGQELTVEEKKRMGDNMNNRMEACERCPVGVLAVWSEEICP